MTVQNKAVVYSLVRNFKDAANKKLTIQSHSGLRRHYYCSKKICALRELQIISEHIDRCPDKSANIFTRPVFEAALVDAKKEDATLIVYDLFMHLAILPNKDAQTQVSKLGDGDVDIIDSYLNIKLQDLDGMLIRNIIQGRRYIKASQKRAAPRDKPSPKATKASAISRQREARKFAAQLSIAIRSIETKASEAGRKATLAHIASELNAKGITTRHGNKWTPIAVSRVKKTIDELIKKGILSFKSKT